MFKMKQGLYLYFQVLIKSKRQIN